MLLDKLSVHTAGGGSRGEEAWQEVGQARLSRYQSKSVTGVALRCPLQPLWGRPLSSHSCESSGAAGVLMQVICALPSGEAGGLVWGRVEAWRTRFSNVALPLVKPELTIHFDYV